MDQPRGSPPGPGEEAALFRPALSRDRLVGGMVTQNFLKKEFSSKFGPTTPSKPRYLSALDLNTKLPSKDLNYSCHSERSAAE
jgi:hypothetical protein